MTTPGVLLAGRYRLHTRIASGGMGSVWEAEDEVLGRRVAVKLLLPQPGTSYTDAQTARNRVIREARITARLHHPHAVTIYDVVEHAGQPCLIMQFVPSRSLNSILQERGVLPELQVARIGAELASALTAAHLAGIVHRDVKPSNVLITPEGSAKLTDFGISHAAGDVNLTSTGMVSGTPAYLAPEVARGAQSGFPADVFSLGATLYAALEGAPPFGTDVNPMAILHRVASGQVITPRRSGSLTPLLLHMLAPVPEHRPTMDDVAQALAVAAAGPAPLPESERPTTSLPPPTVREWPSDPPVRAASLSETLLGAGHLPDPPGSPLPADVEAGATPATDSRRRSRVVGAVLAIVLIGLVAVGISALSRRGNSGTASSAATTAPSASLSSGSGSGSRTASPAARPTSAAAAQLPISAAPKTSPKPAPRSAGSATRATSSAATTSAATTSAVASTTTARATPPTTSRSTSTSPTTSSTSSSSVERSSTSSSSSTSTSPSSEADTGTPTGAQLAAAVTDYYSGLPTDTDNGWAHLTQNFRTKIAHGRGNYQAFWDGIASVTLDDVQGTAPGTVDATVTYRLKNGQTSVENTRFQLVRSDGILKIDSQQ